VGESVRRIEKTCKHLISKQGGGLFPQIVQRCADTLNEMNSKVLIVGSPSEGLRLTLSGDFAVQTCETPAEALQLLLTEKPAVLICSLREETAALDFIGKACTLSPGTRVALAVPTVWSDNAARLAESIPIMLLPAETRPAIASANLQRFVSEARKRTEHKEFLEGTVRGCVTVLYEVLSIVDPYSASLGQRLRYATELFCKSGGFELSWELETAALLAEIGVLTIPVRVASRMHSGQELSDFEQEMIANLPGRGADLLAEIPALGKVGKIVRFQDKNFDGTGLPSVSIARETIPQGSRILKILNDLFELKEQGQTQEDAIHTMENRNGCYDPALLQIAGKCFEVNLPGKIPASTVGTTVKGLKPGQLLVSNIETEDGVLVIRDGQVVSPRLIHKLRNFAFTSGIREPIYVIDLLESRSMTTAFHNITQSETAFLFK
jgi:hypothetical protein